MKHLFTLFCLAAIICCPLSAVDIGDFHIVGDRANAYLTQAGIDNPSEFGNSVCMGLQDTLTITISNEVWQSAKEYTWQPRGSVAIVGDTNGQTIQLVSTSNSKGRIYFRYITEHCNEYVYFDIFKSFSGAAIEVSGPSCFILGDIVVFSVRPILTEHLNHQIGMDYYYWNLTDPERRPAFVDSIIYVAGDGSAVTFVAGEAQGGDYAEIFFGVCNQDPEQAARLYLGKKAPKPQVETEVCVPYGKNRTINLQVENPAEGVEYSWWCKNALWNFTNTMGNATTVTLDAMSAEEIIVTSSFIGDNSCDGTQDTIYVRRSWGENVAMSSSAKDFRYRVGQTYEFTLSGDISTGEIEWQLPAGWEIASNSSQGRTNILVRPTAEALLVDTIVARTQSCSESGYDQIAHEVYVYPAAVEAIAGAECLSIGETYTFYVNKEGDAPKAATYTWQIDGDTESYSAFTGDTLTFTATAGMENISVRPNGIAGCNGVFYSHHLTFRPATPEGIIADDCIAYNMPDTVTFSIDNPIPNQTYGWTIPAEWRIVSTHTDGQAIDVRTTGIVGTYDISAYGIGGEDTECGNSDIVSTTIDVGTGVGAIEPRVVIGFGVMFFGIDIPTNIANFQWYLVHNGQWVNDNVFGPSSYNYAPFLEPYASLIGDPTNSKEYTVVLEYETTDGCKTRITCGVPLNPSIDYMRGTLAPFYSRRIMSNMAKTAALNLYPNPTTSILNISMQDSSDFDIQIITMEGIEMYAQYNAQSHYIVDVSTYPAGNYIAIATQNGRQKAMTLFIKQ